jgi:hypothetical protein
MHWIVWLTAMAILQYGARFHHDPQVREWCAEAGKFAPYGLVMLFLAGLPVLSGSSGPSTLAVHVGVFMVLIFLAVVASTLKARLFWLGMLILYFLLFVPILHWVGEVFTPPQVRPRTPLRLPNSISIR